MERTNRTAPQEIAPGKICISLAAINIAIFLILNLSGDTRSGEFMAEHGAMYPPLITEEGKWYLLLTAVFLHFDLSHLANNMIMLVAVGSYVEREMGPLRFLLFYLLCGLGSSGISLWWNNFTGDLAVSAGASGAIFGCVGGLLALAIKHKGRVQGLGIRNILLMAALSLYAGFTTAGVDNAGHVGGFVTGLLLGFLFQKGLPEGAPD